MEKQTGGPAFPCEITGVDDVGEYRKPYEGMTLRDYFAAKAMQGICASKDEAGILIQHGYDWIANEAYKIADTMLEVRAV